MILLSLARVTLCYSRIFEYILLLFVSRVQFSYVKRLGTLLLFYEPRLIERALFIIFMFSESNNTN